MTVIKKKKHRTKGNEQNKKNRIMHRWMGDLVVLAAVMPPEQRRRFDAVTPVTAVTQLEQLRRFDVSIPVTAVT